MGFTEEGSRIILYDHEQISLLAKKLKLRYLTSEGSVVSIDSGEVEDMYDYGAKETLKAYAYSISERNSGFDYDDHMQERVNTFNVTKEYFKEKYVKYGKDIKKLNKIESRSMASIRQNGDKRQNVLELDLKFEENSELAKKMNEIFRKGENNG